MTTLTQTQIKTLTRLRTNFRYWAANCWTIIDKSGNYRKLVLNDAQEHVLKIIERQEVAGLPIRIIILKGRQQGISTLIEAWQCWKVTTQKAKRAFVLAHDADSSATLFAQAKRGYENLPDIVKPAKKRSNKKELLFGLIDSSIELATAGGNSIARGKTLQYVHASEVAFWAPSTAEANFNGLAQAVPRVPDSLLAVESTAQGMGNLFHNLCTEAMTGRSEFEFVFVPWFWQSEYVLPVPDNFSRTPEETWLAKEYSLTDAQLMWRRNIVATFGTDYMKQEYPCTAHEAFLNSGRPAFDPDTVHRLRLKAQPAKERFALESGVFEKHAKGNLHVWREPDPTETYYIGVDVAEGVRGGDYSVAQVLDSQRRQCAVWRGHVLPREFSYELYELGDWYNRATIAVEINNHGLTTATHLAKDLGYSDVWTETTVDKITEEETTRFGFSTNPKTRPLILDKLRQHVRDGTMEIVDPVTLDEMTTFVINPNGKMEAERDSHDDHVMALAIANHINAGAWRPIKNQAHWYVEMS